MTINFISLFTGICGFDLGLERAGMECVAQVEIDPACRKLEERHYPDVERFEDVRTYTPNSAVDLICGGFPCQDLSVAGKRSGLAGERSGLWFEFHRILEVARPQWVVIENVPGLLSSNGGRDFAVILRGLVELWYGVAWRILDAQYFGVAQRRRRVFVVGSLRDGRVAEVLFEREGGARDTPPGREAGAGITPAVANGINGSGLRGRQPGSAASYVANAISSNPANRLSGEDNYVPGVARPLANSSTPDHYDESQLTVGGADMTAIAWDLRQVTSQENRSLPQVDYSPMINQAGQMMSGVRRLTPTECERLQGFPDGWTDGQADSTRYRQLGNAVCVPVVEWIGKQIMRALEATP
jgi:DNA (cytosine-5)-methyltransferase 1